MQEFLDDGTKNGEYPRRYALQAIFTHNDDATSEDITKWINDFNISVVIVPKEQQNIQNKLNLFERIYETQDYIIFYNSNAK